MKQNYKFLLLVKGCCPCVEGVIGGGGGRFPLKKLMTDRFCGAWDFSPSGMVDFFTFGEPADFEVAFYITDVADERWFFDEKSGHAESVIAHGVVVLVVACEVEDSVGF